MSPKHLDMLISPKILPYLTNPPAVLILSYSSGKVGLCSVLRIIGYCHTYPIAFESPQLATYIRSLVKRTTNAVQPVIDYP